MPTKQIECFYPVCGCHSECQSGSSTTTADQSQIDRAHEVTGESHPEADGAEYEQHFTAALADIVAINRAADRTETPPHAR